MILKGDYGPASFMLRRNQERWSFSGQPEILLGYKTSLVEDEQGVWASWHWTGERVELRSSYMGFFPLFYHYSEGLFGVSTSILDLLENGVPADLDDEAIAVFLRLGWFVGNDTPFRAVRAVPQNTKMKWQGGILDVSSGEVVSHAKASSTPRTTAVREYGRLFELAMEKHLPDASDVVCVPLSGGRDSRHILFALLGLGSPPHICATVRGHPPQANEDAVFASQVCEAVGLSHVILEQTEQRVAAELRKNILTSFCAREHAWILPLSDYVKENGISVLYDGIGGDVLSAGLFLNEERLHLFETQRLTDLANHLLGGEGYLPKLLPKPLYRRWSRGKAMNRLKRELAHYVGCPNPVTQFFFWNRTRRSIALSTWSILANSQLHVYAPYLDLGLYEFLASLPAAYFLDHRFHTEAINARYPKHSSISFAAKHAAETRWSRRNIIKYSWDVSKLCAFTPQINYWSFVAPRLAKGIVDAAYGARLPSVLWTATYLCQLGQLRNVSRI